MKRSELEAVLEALAEPSRRLLLGVLVGSGEASASVASEKLPISRQAIVKHLGLLQACGLVTSRRVGREVRYFVRPDRLEAASRELEVMAAEWGLRLTMVRRGAERSGQSGLTGPFGMPRPI